MRKILSKWYWFIILGFIFATAGIFIVLGEDSIIAVHDNLDLFMPQYKMMKDTGTFLAHDVYVPFMGDISRDYLPSEFNVYTWLFMALPGYYAYIAGYVLKIVIAIVGAYLLARDILKESTKKYEGLILLTGFAYGILNLFPNFSICFASIPLLVFILRKIINKDRLTPVWFLLLFLYPLLSYFSYFGLFILGYMSLYFVYRIFKTKKFPIREFLAIIILAAGFVACEYRLFSQMLFSDTESIRGSMVIETLDAKGILLMIWEGIAIGDMHSEALQLKFIMPVCIIFGIVQIVLYIKNKELKKIVKDPFFGVLLFIIFNGVVYGLYYCGPVRHLFDTLIPPLAGLQYTRTGYFNPFLWYVALFIVAKRLYDMGASYKKAAVIPAYLIVLGSIFVTVVSGTRYNDFYHTMASEYHYIRSGEKNNELSFREFYSEKLFDKALSDIEYCGEWSLAYGFYPAILEYNGIRTLDGYLGYYEQGYKDYFRKIIAPALDRRPESAAYFDNWGARCTLYSGTYPSNVTAERYYDIEGEDLFIDINYLKKLAGRYIFARMEITNADEAGFELAGKYTDEQSPYTLYVYRTKSWYPEKEHSDIPYKDREVPKSDAGGILENYETFKGYVADAKAYKELHEDMTDEEVVAEIGHGDELFEIYDNVLEVIGEMSTAHSMYDIAYYQDVTNDEFSELMNAVYADYMDIVDGLLVMLKEACDSPYVFVARERLTQDDIDSLLEYEEMTEEKKERALKQKSLENEYLQAYSEEYYFEYKGKTWTEAMLYEEAESLSEEDMNAIIVGLYKEKTKVVGEIFLELVKLRNEIAEEEGYDNYAEYAYEELFNRDYSVEDSKKLIDNIKKGGSFYLSKIYGILEETEVEENLLMDSDIDTFKMLQPYFEDIDSELGNSVAHLIDLGLCDMNAKPNKGNAGFTTELESFGDAFIFDNPFGGASDLFTYVHEFGHFSRIYYLNEEPISSVTNMDTSEIHSQGLEMLFTTYYGDIYGEELGNSITITEIGNIVSNLISEAAVAELEIYIYENPDKSIEDYSKEFTRIYRELGYAVNYKDESGACYNWIDISHIFVQPCYYISYLTTALSSMEIYNIAQTNRHEAITKYMEITALPSAFPYSDTMEYVGMTDIFEGKNSVKILSDTYAYLKKLSKN